MSEPNKQPDKKPDTPLLSIFLLVFGVLSLVGSVIVVFSRSREHIFIALPGFAIATVLFALSRILNYLNEIAERQKRMETRLDKQSDQT